MVLNAQIISYQFLTFVKYITLKRRHLEITVTLLCDRKKSITEVTELIRQILRKYMVISKIWRSSYIETRFEFGNLFENKLNA